MEKARLRKIERKTASEESIALANRTKEAEHIIEADMIDDNILQMTFFKADELRKGNTQPMFRTFFQEDDYINQDLSVKTTKWFTSSLWWTDKVQLYDHKYDSEREVFKKTERVACSKNDRQIISSFFKEYEKENDDCKPWQAVHKYQGAVLKKKLDKKHKKETDKIDAVMEQVKDVPEDFEDWIKNVGMSDRCYLVYKPKGKARAELFCNRCNGRTEVSRKEIALKNNQKVICPMCGHEVTAKVLGRMPVHIIDNKNVSLVQRTEKGFLWREFYVRRILYRKDLETADYISETNRFFYEERDNRATLTGVYVWDTYKQTGKTRWCEIGKYLYTKSTLLYPNNLPVEWEHTSMKYSAFEIMAEKEPTKEYEYRTGIYRYLDNNRVEHLIKMGLTKIVGTMFSSGYYSQRLEFEQKSIFDVLKLDKERTRLLQSVNGDFECLHILQLARKKNIAMDAATLKEFRELFGNNPDLLEKKRKNVSIQKFIRYFKKESSKYISKKCRYRPGDSMEANMASDWLDYISWCEELGYDLNDNYYYMPKNFKTAHDNVAREYTALMDKKEAERQKRDAEKLEKRMQAAQIKLKDVLKDGVFTDGKGLAILLPHDAAEIKEEGRILHHCVGTYVGRVASGQTTILFVRKQDDIQAPYFTLEWNNGHIVQCRGSHNCGMPEAVKRFTDAFEKKMQAIAVNNK